MIRRAILIGHNDASAIRNGALRGVTNDVVNTRAFLLSDGGGAWEENEISWYGAPPLADLRMVLAQAKATCDHLFIAFSGHGAHGPGGSFVCINNDETIYVNELAQLGPKARRIVVISDACRVEVSVPVPQPTRIVVGEAAGVPDAAYRRSCRLAYTNVLGNATEGAVVMYSCLQGETSGDSVHGGIFTQALLRSASQWAEEVSNGQQVRWILPVRDAFNRIDMPAQTRRRPGGQTPCLRPENPPNFPFAVA